MAVIKCKMCGGDLNVQEGTSIAECEYCGTQQTIPNVDNEKKLTLFSRANRLRLAGEFDKAASIYENIVAEFPSEAEAYWGLVLCRYGIEYVDDPATGKKIPTCHRSSFSSIFEDEDFEQACENTDAVARRVYRDEAKAIENIRKGILEISAKEPPYDIFICYKETDENGQRTLDSVLAQDVYDALNEKGYKVFFSRITLEDKLGTEYEPYIFAALNSAKVMLVFGTDYEYFNAVWVKNEWSRYLKLIAQDKNKHLIPCYKNVDAYDIPKEFQKFQGQDLGKVGAMQDLLRGIDKLIKGRISSPSARTTEIISEFGPTSDSLLKRGLLFLEDNDWKNADQYFNRVLDINPECAEAYLGKFCAQNHCTKFDNIAEPTQKGELLQIEGQKNFLRAEQFAEGAFAKKIQQIKERHSLKAAQIENGKMDRLRFMRAQNEKVAHLIDMSSSHDPITVLTNGTLKCPIKTSNYTCDPHLKHLNTPYFEHLDSLSDIAGIICTHGRHRNYIGVKSDGTLEPIKIDEAAYTIKEWQSWTNIIDLIFVDKYFSDTRNYEISAILGLKSDGTLVTAGKGVNSASVKQVEKWTNIKSIFYYCYDKFSYPQNSGVFFALLKNGTIISSETSSDNWWAEILNWDNIVSLAVCRDVILGVKHDGRVVSAINKDGKVNKKAISSIEHDVSSWTDIANVFMNDFTPHIAIGLKATGTVVFSPSPTPTENANLKEWLEEWTDIIAVSVGGRNILGLKKDGTLEELSDNNRAAYDWRLFNNIDTIEEERIEARRLWRIEESHRKEKEHIELEAKREKERIELEAKREKERIELKERMEKELPTLLVKKDEKKARYTNLLFEQAKLEESQEDLASQSFFKQLASRKDSRKIQERVTEVTQELSQLEIEIDKLEKSIDAIKKELAQYE